MKKRTSEYTFYVELFSSAKPNILLSIRVSIEPVNLISPVSVTFSSAPPEDTRGATYIVSQAESRSTSKLTTRLLSFEPLCSYISEN